MWGLERIEFELDTPGTFTADDINFPELLADLTLLRALVEPKLKGYDEAVTAGPPVLPDAGRH